MKNISKEKNNVNQFINYSQNTTEPEIYVHQNTTGNTNYLFGTMNIFFYTIVNIFNDIVSSLKENPLQT